MLSSLIKYSALVYGRTGPASMARIVCLESTWLLRPLNVLLFLFFMKGREVQEIISAKKCHTRFETPFAAFEQNALLAGICLNRAMICFVLISFTC